MCALTITNVNATMVLPVRLAKFRCIPTTRTCVDTCARSIKAYASPAPSLGQIVTGHVNATRDTRVRTVQCSHVQIIAITTAFVWTIICADAH